MDYIEELEGAILKLHGAKAKHTKSVPVKETFEGQTVWEGVVEVFELEGHPNARIAYAWAHGADDPKKSKQFVTVLSVPPVTSPEKAVRAAIVQEYREHGKRKEN